MDKVAKTAKKAMTPSSMAELSRRIFGNLPIDTNCERTGNKIIRKKLKGDKIASYYTRPMDMFIAPFDDYHKHNREDREAKLDQLRRRGKGPPKKGAGKRAQKNKKK